MSRYCQVTVVRTALFLYHPGKENHREVLTIFSQVLKGNTFMSILTNFIINGKWTRHHELAQVDDSMQISLNYMD